MKQTHIHWYGWLAALAGCCFRTQYRGRFGVVQSPGIVFDLLGVVLLLGWMGVPFGFFSLRAAGRRRMGLIGAVITLLGLLSYLNGVVYTRVIDPEMGSFYALGALLAGADMLLPSFVNTLLCALQPLLHGSPSLSVRDSNDGIEGT